LRAAQSFAAIAERLGDVDAGDACLAVDIGKRAGDAKCSGMFQRGETLGLDGAGRSDTGAHLGTSFRRRRQHEVGRRDRRHFDLQIDAVEQGP
jgi:hypothetical protein